MFKEDNENLEMNTNNDMQKSEENSFDSNDEVIINYYEENLEENDTQKMNQESTENQEANDIEYTQPIEYTQSYNFEQDTVQNNEEFSNEQNINQNLNGQYNKKKKNKGHPIRTMGAVAGIVILAFGGGLLGGYLGTNNKWFGNSSNGSTLQSTNNNSVQQYTAPEFLSSTDGSLTASEAIEKVKPAVVTISTVSTQNYYGMYSQDVEGIGSGIIVSEDGYIITNYHVIENSKDVNVKMSYGEEVSATVVNYDQKKDIAMLKLEDGTKVPGVAELGDSEALYPGQEVIAIGTPVSKEFEYTCTKGIVSALNREVKTSTGISMQLIQTDAAINPGNSGGPLINTKGQVIGINSMKIVVTEVDGLGFAIPINEVKERLDTLSKPIISLGIQCLEITDKLSKENNLPKGVYIKGIDDFSSAQKAGLRVGDVIIEFNGKRIETYDQLNEAKNAGNVGDEVEVVVYRNDSEQKLTMVLEQK